MGIPTVDQVIRAQRGKGYVVFDDPRGYDLNIVGIRAANRAAGKFDDLIVVYHRYLDTWVSQVFPATTDPGVHWLQNPMTERGTAILCEGQYRGAWQVGLHQNRYEALVQRRPMQVIRDNNRDSTLDFDGRIEEGLFGINLHHASPAGVSAAVDRWSAGCQVLASYHDFTVLMAMAKAAVAIFGNSFTYTLLNDSDFGVLP